MRYTSDGDAGWLDRSPIRKGIEIVPGDLADRNSVFSACRGREIVFHLGALIAIAYSYEAPESYVRTNILGTLNVLHAVRELSIGRLVHTSTSEVYGSAQTVPMTEAHPLVGQSRYPASKIGADKLAESYHRSFETPVVTLRPSNQSAGCDPLDHDVAAGRRTIRLGGHPADAGFCLRRRHGGCLRPGRHGIRRRGSDDPIRRGPRDRDRRPARHDRCRGRPAGQRRKSIRSESGPPPARSSG